MKMFKKYALTVCSLLAVVSFGQVAQAQFNPMMQNQQQTSQPAFGQFQGGFSAPRLQSVGEQAAYSTPGNGCNTVRYDNTRMQNGQLVPAQGGGSHFFGG